VGGGEWTGYVLEIGKFTLFRIMPTICIDKIAVSVLC